MGGSPHLGGGKGGKGGGKGKGAGKGGGGGGGKGKTVLKDTAWQCRNCKAIWNGKDAAFCGGCGKKKTECIRLPKPDANIQAVINENKKMRQELEDLKKSFDKNNKAAPAVVKQNVGGGGGGNGGNGGGGVKGGGSHGNPTSYAQQLSPKPLAASNVMVQYCGQSISLQELNSILEATKPCFPESHPRVIELRQAIDEAHRLRSENTDAKVLVVQTEKNIANQERIIEKAQSRVEELRAQRAELEKALVEEEARIKHATSLLDTFRSRLEEAQLRQKKEAESAGTMPKVLDTTPGQPVLREWLKTLHPAAHATMVQNSWNVPISCEHAEQFTCWSDAMEVVNSFATYARTRTLQQVEAGEAQEARKCLAIIAASKVASLATGQARRAVEVYPNGTHPTKVPFSIECEVLLEWCQAEQSAFAAIHPAKQRATVAPYWKPEKPGEEGKPIVLKSDFKGDYWAQARGIIRAQYGEVEPQDLPTHTNDEAMRRAAQLYCTAVVENEDEVEKIPRFSEYVETITKGIKRQGEPAETLEMES